MPTEAKLSDLVKGVEEPQKRVSSRAINVGLAVAGVGVLLVAVVVWLPRVSIGERGGSGTSWHASSPIAELMRYHAAMKSGQVSFDTSIPGEEAAKRLGFSTLFACAYGELREIAKKQGSAAVLPALGRIVEEEQVIDLLMARHARITPVAVLRALQNGELVFPPPRDKAPSSRELIAALAQKHPEVKLDPSDATFAEIYEGTQKFAASRMETGGVSVYELIGELRRGIVASVMKKDS